MESLNDVVATSKSTPTSSGEDEVAPTSSEVSMASVLTPFTSPYNEIINARLAMIGFALGALGESSGSTFMQQFNNEPLVVLSWVGFVLGVTALVESGNKTDDASADSSGTEKSKNFFNPKHELAIGRVAMLGFLGTVIVENKFNAPFF